MSKRRKHLMYRWRDGSAVGAVGQSPGAELVLATWCGKDLSRSELAELLWEWQENVCSNEMVFRYVLGRPAWVCPSHNGDDDLYKFYYRFIERPTPALQTTPKFNLGKAIKASLDGSCLDLVWDRGEWKVRQI